MLSAGFETVIPAIMRLQIYVFIPRPPGSASLIITLVHVGEDVAVTIEVIVVFVEAAVVVVLVIAAAVVEVVVVVVAVAAVVSLPGATSSHLWY